MNLADVVNVAGRNQLCRIAENHKSYIFENCKSFSVNIDLDDGALTCYPASVVAQYCFKHNVSSIDDSLSAFDDSIQKQVERLKRFSDNAIEKLEEKFDAETIMKSPCIAFASTAGGATCALNLCPMDICDKLY